MAKIAIVTDSNSGITQAQAKELGVFVLPMPFYIDGELFYEDINLTQEQFYEKLMQDAEISTSQPAPGDILDLWDKILEEYDQIVHIPMSSGLSGSCQSARMLAEDYDGRVEVVDNQRISVTMRLSVLDAKTMAERGMSAREIREYLEETKFDSTIYIMLDTLKYLKKGGRITPAAAALGTLLRIRPVLQIQGEKLDAFSKARTARQGKATMLQQINTDITQRFGLPESGVGVHIAMAYSGTDRTEIDAFYDEVKAIYPAHDILVAPLSLSVSCHIGPGAIAVTATKVLQD